MWWKSGPIYCYAESKKASLGGAAVSRQIPSSSKNWSLYCLSHSHEGAHCTLAHWLSTKFHRPAFHVDAAHVDMSLPYGDTPGYETPAGTILIAISRQTLSYGFFSSNKVSQFFILIFHLFKEDDRLQNSFKRVQNVLKYLLLVGVGQIFNCMLRKLLISFRGEICMNRQGII